MQILQERPQLQRKMSSKRPRRRVATLAVGPLSAAVILGAAILIAFLIRDLSRPLILAPILITRVPGDETHDHAEQGSDR
jgi:hypothetical protein